jgi:hypothetical protein
VQNLLELTAKALEYGESVTFTLRVEMCSSALFLTGRALGRLNRPLLGLPFLFAFFVIHESLRSAAPRL